jgi:hypothetical protein
MFGAGRSTGVAMTGGDFRLSHAPCGGFAPSSGQISSQISGQISLDAARGCRGRVAKPRRANQGFGRAPAHFLGFAATTLPVGPSPASCKGEKLSRREGVLSCGQSLIHSDLRFAQPCPAVATQPASRQSMARAPVRLARRCWMAILSPVQPSVQPPMSSIAKKTPANAEGGFALSRLTCQPFWAAQDIHANAAAEPCAPLRRSAFRHTKEQGTANV